MRLSLLVTALLASASASSQSTPPRTPWGHPDLQGIWANNTATPLGRPEVYEGDEAIFEYACHEGNIAMEGILKGARADEKAAEEQPK